MAVNGKLAAKNEVITYDALKTAILRTFEKKTDTSIKLSEHWNKIFNSREENQLGWYEENHYQSLRFLNYIPGWERLKIFIAGAGISGLIEQLLKTRAELVLNDISAEAIEKAKSKYSAERSSVRWLCHDISQPLPADVKDIDIWFDRAVLHFLTGDKDIEQYFRNVKAAVKDNGYAIFAEFSKTGATKCAGLDVRRYDVHDLEERLAGFELMKSEEYTFINPRGEARPYIYTLFKKLPDSQRASS